MATKKSIDDVIAREAENYYRELHFPLPYLQKPGHPVDDMALISTVKPILEGVYALLLAQAESLQVELCLSILNRWWEEGEHADRK